MTSGAGEAVAKTSKGIAYYFTPAATGGDVETIALIMGYGGSARVWPQTLVRRLAAGYNVLTLDNRGTGLSFLPAAESDYTIAAMAEDFGSVLDDLKIASAHVLGYSMGGCIAIEFAVENPQRVKSLFLLSTTGGGTTYVRPERAVSSAMANPQGKTLWEVYDYTFKLMFAPQTYPLVEPALRAIYEVAKATPTRPLALRGHSHAFRNFDASGRLDRLSMPVTIMTGAEDRLMPAANSSNLAAAIGGPGQRLIVVPACEHGVHIEVEDLVITEIMQTIARART